MKGQAREINENTEDELKRLRNVATVPKINGQYLVLFLGCFVGQNRLETTITKNRQFQDSYADRV